jgi:hypothetical protein
MGQDPHVRHGRRHGSWEPRAGEEGFSPAVDLPEHAFRTGNVQGRAAVAGGPSLGRAEVLHLQRTVGNAAVSQLLTERKLARAPEVADPELEEAEEEHEEELEEETAEAGTHGETAAGGGTWNATKRGVRQGWDNVKNAAGQAFDAAKTTAGQAFNTAKTRIGQGWDKAKTAAGDALTAAKLHRPAVREARRLIADASREAPAVEKALMDVAGKYGGELIGLDFRVKSLDSLARKIRDGALRAPPGTTPAQAVKEQADEIRDALRYTMELDPATYTTAFDDISATLIAQGFRSAKVKNGWAADSPYKGAYKGINSSWVTPSGQVFELQFHTAESFGMKQHGTHKLYEEQRKAGTSAARKAEIEKELLEMFASVPTPAGAEGIRQR